MYLEYELQFFTMPYSKYLHCKSLTNIKVPVGDRCFLCIVHTHLNSPETLSSTEASVGYDYDRASAEERGPERLLNVNIITRTHVNKITLFKLRFFSCMYTKPLKIKT
jgi:hypothetical protein